MSRNALWAGLLGGAALAVGLCVWWGLRQEVAVTEPASLHVKPAPEASSALPVSLHPAGDLPQERTSASDVVPQRVAVPDSFAPEAGEGLLRILVLARETREPLSGIHFFLSLASGPDSIAVEVRGTRTRTGDRPQSTEEGRVDLIVPAGEEYVLRVRGGREVQHKELHVPALGAVEQRELTILLTTQNDLPFCGVVIDLGSGAPVARAEVLGLGGVRYPLGQGRRSERGGFQVLPVDAMGRFDVLAATWREPAVRISAPGYSEQVIAVEPGHELPDQARVIRLLANANLMASVQDAEGRPLEGIWLRLKQPSVRGRPAEKVWEGTTDVEGACTLRDLPPRKRLTLALYQGGNLVHIEADPLELSPGEERTFEFTLGGGVELHGLLLDQYEEPIPDYTVWMKRNEGWELGFFGDFEQVLIKATTDVEGRFIAQDVAPGSWLIGPAQTRKAWDAPDPGAVAPEQRRVEITALPLRQECVIHAQRGVYIRGFVVDEDGDPLQHIMLSCARVGGRDLRGARSRDSTREGTRADGAFVLGPVGAGSYEVSAKGGPDRRGRRSVIVQGGASNVILRLELGGGVSGVVRDAGGGELANARMELTTVGPGGKTVGWYSTGTSGGEFRLMNPRDGLHNLTARTTDGRFGILSGLRVYKNVAVEDLEILVRPGGRLVCRYEGSEVRVGFSVWLGDVEVGRGGFRDHGTSTLVVPDGLLSIKFRGDDQQTSQTRTVFVRPGEEREVVFR